MNRPLSRLPRFLLASTILLSAVAIAAAGRAPRDPATGASSGQRMHAPFTVSTQVSACTATTAGATNAASDPEEGGQLAAHAADTTQAGPLKATSDPEEGGQIARTAKPRPKPSVSDLTVTKKSDTASTTLAQAAPAPSATPSCH